MGSIKELLVNKGFNTKERAYIYTGAVAGAIAPIIAARYLFFNGIESDSLFAEGAKWVGALIVNFAPMCAIPPIPFPLYGAVGGMTVGCLTALGSKRKRYKKEKNLENVTNNLQENSPLSLEK